MSRLNRLSKTYRVVDMLAKGYPRKVIEIESGFTNKHISKIASDLVSSGIDLNSNRKTAKQTMGSTLIHKKNDLKVTAAILAIYIRVTSFNNEDPKTNINTATCETALGVALAGDIAYTYKGNKVYPTYGDIYHIAKLYQAGFIDLVHCKKCRTSYLQVVGQNRRSVCLCKDE